MSILDKELERAWNQIDGGPERPDLVFIPRVGTVLIDSPESLNYFRSLKEFWTPRDADGGTSVP